MEELLRRAVGDRLSVVIATERIDGDLHPKHVAPAQLRARQAAITGRPWTMLDQVHGVQCHHCVSAAVGPGTAAVGDVLATTEPDLPLAIWAADCAPVVLFGLSGTTVALHAGWRGLAAGVVDVGVGEIHARGDRATLAVLGPTIHPCCYEFGERDLKVVASGSGLPCEAISGQTRAGRLALDVPAAVIGALAKHEVDVVASAGCTGCGDRWFSHRVRGDAERHAVVAWTES